MSPLKRPGDSLTVVALPRQAVGPWASVNWLKEWFGPDCERVNTALCGEKG